MLNRNEEMTEKIIKFLILILILFVPNILKVVEKEFVSPVLEPLSMRTGVYINIFVQNKFSFLIATTVFIALFFMILLYKKNINMEIYDLLVAIFIISSIFSTYFSENTNIAFWGKYNRTDGSLFFIVIMILLFIASKIKFSDKDINRLSYAFSPFLVINCTLAYMFQNGIDFLKSNFFNDFVLSGGKYNIGEGGFILSTLENPNYLSGLAGFLAVYYIARFTLLEKRYFDGIAAILSIILIISSFSSSGIISVLVAILMLVILVFLSSEGNRYFYFKLGLFFPIIFIILKYYKLRNPIIANELYSLQELFVNNKLSLGIFLLVLFVLMYLVKNYFNFFKKRYILSGIINLVIFMVIFVTPYSNYHNQSYPDKLYERNEIFEIIERKEIKTDLLSNRLFTWENTIDLIKEKPLTGYGFGTLVFKLNQNSIFEPYTAWPQTIIFDKPHNTYLEVAYGGGIFALISFVLIFVNLFFQSMESLREKFDPRNLSIFLGMIAFLIQGLVNDSNVGSYPVMFIFFGVLISRLNNNEEVLEEISNGKKKSKHKSN